ncbi:MAG: DUF4372 domain-containing protein [Prevotellaceae bacterium]|nr:DUF4372 domain-containing protein [Prevotellaceae bacterium]
MRDIFSLKNVYYTVFAQLVEFLPQRVFDTIAVKYAGNKSVRH